MPLPISCPTCGHSATVPDSFAGKRISCPRCKAAFVVASTSPLTATPPLDVLPINDEPPVAARSMRRCPECREEIKADARKCKHCGERLDEPRRRDRRDEDSDDEPRRQPTESMDAAGILSLIFGAIGLICVFLTCCTFGISAYVAIPICAVGLGAAIYSNTKTPGIVFNSIVFLPAVVLTIVFALGMAGAMVAK